MSRLADWWFDLHPIRRGLIGIAVFLAGWGVGFGLVGYVLRSCG